MTQNLKTVPVDAMHGTANGVLFMTLFGALWAYTGIMGLQSKRINLLLVIVVTVCIVLLIGYALLIRASRQVTNQVSEMDVKKRHRKRKWFKVIFATEVVVILMAVAICNTTRNSEFIPFAITLIVGIHFFPLAYLFQVRIYYFTAILFCLLAIITWLFIPLKVMLVHNYIIPFTSVVGIGSALILWSTALAMLLKGKKLLNTVLK